MVHRNIHDEEVSEALEHENGLTVLGFKFQVDNLEVDQMKNEIVGYQVVSDDHPHHPSMDTLARIAENFLTQPNSKFQQNDFKRQVREIHFCNTVL